MNSKSEFMNAGAKGEWGRIVIRLLVSGCSLYMVVPIAVAGIIRKVHRIIVRNIR